jgi:hypothetical protein
MLSALSAQPRWTITKIFNLYSGLYDLCKDQDQKFYAMLPISSYRAGSLWIRIQGCKAIVQMSKGTTWVGEEEHSTVQLL